MIYRAIRITRDATGRAEHYQELPTIDAPDADAALRIARERYGDGEYDIDVVRERRAADPVPMMNFAKRR